MEDWIKHVREDVDEATTTLLDFIEEFLYKNTLPTLDTTNARIAAGRRVDFGFDRELLTKYVTYACRN